MKPRYALRPGVVVSKNDGQRHYISADKLAFLYGVSMRECVIYEPRPGMPDAYYEVAEREIEGLRILEPRYDGNYTLIRKSSLT